MNVRSQSATLHGFGRLRDVCALAFVFVAISVASLAYLVTLLP